MNTPTWFHRAALLWWMLAGPIGCTSWRVESVPPAELLERDHPAAVRLQKVDGRREVLHRPELRGDSLWGREDSASGKAGSPVAIADVTKVETSHISGGKTVALVLGIGTVVVVALAAATYSMDPMYFGN
jgi:hypothetical protein